jgi:hypothetical protein
VLALIGVGLVGLTLISVLVGLAIGAAPHRLARGGQVADRGALILGTAAGLFGAAVAAISSWLRTPEWAHVASVAGLGTVVPVLAAAAGPLPGFLTRLAVMLSALMAVDHFSSGWTRRRVLCGTALVLIGILGTGLPRGGEVTGWLAAGAITGVALLALYAWLLRADLTLTVPALAVMAALGAIAQGLARPFPGALAGSIIAAVLVAAMAWWWFRALRRGRARAAGATASGGDAQVSTI